VQTNITHPIKLTINADQARKLVEQIPHATCRGAAEAPLERFGRIQAVPEESINWLFCWAKNGDGK